MSDRVPATITIGGTVTAEIWQQLVAHIAAEALTIEWGGPVFNPQMRVVGEPLRLFALETPWGIFDDLEQFCCGHRLPYLRWSGGSTGNCSPERIVFDGKSGPYNYDVDDQDRVVLTADVIAQLGSMRAIRRYLRQADIIVPPLVLLS